MSSLHFASALSTDPDARVAEERCVATLGAALVDAPDLLLVFANHHYGEALDGLGRRLRAATGARLLAGCTGGMLIGGAREVEEGPAISILAARLPGVEVRAQHILARHDAAEDWTFSAFPELARPDEGNLLLLADPFTFPMPEFLAFLDGELPGVQAVGGMASGGLGPGQNLLFLDDDVLHYGALALSLEGGVQVRSAVSQGCRPVGDPYVITSCRDHRITHLRGRKAAGVLLQMLEKLPEGDRRLFRKGAMVGLAVDARKRSFDAGDLLARNIIGLHPKEESIAVTDSSIRAGMTIQFLVRDAESASVDLKETLATKARQWNREHLEPQEVGALLFSCGGRGTRLFRSFHHDVGCLQEVWGPDLPVAGFFANGEIGPVGGRSFLHGYTASVALLLPR